MIDQILTAGLVLVFTVLLIWMFVIETSGLTINGLL